MPRIQTLARVIRSLNIRKTSNKTNSIKSNRSVPVLIATVALLAAVVFSVSVESRRAGWLKKAEPSTPAASNPEVAKNSTTHAAVKRVLEPPTPAVPFVPTVTATKTDFLQVDNDLDTKADPGDTLKYTVVIGAAGEDATGVTFSDTVDTNTAFVPGSIQTTPLARNDSYSASGNIRITVGAGTGVLANDADPDNVGPALTVTAGATSANGGNVSLSADGSFTFNPRAGFEGTDSFTYTLSDGEGNTDTATVTINVTGMIWFINN